MLEWFGVDAVSLVLLFLSALAAGLLDAMAGGGGLITVPALLAAGLPPTQALATNKLQSSFGSGSALVGYARAGRVSTESLGLAVGATALGAVAGTSAVGAVPTVWLTWLVPAALAATLVFVAVRPQWGHREQRARWPRAAFYSVFGLALGFYDGFLGPGTGTFWTVALTGLMGFELLKATAQTKAMNFTSNVVSLAVFATFGHVLWALGLVMGAGQALGARLGSRMALRRGSKLIRPLFLLVAAATLAKVLWTALR